jgi:glycosyltransferase involved in cell wall biosynthesis/peptidoglycan/xylan/chitin deacetylase (PgdA/CDA1 family)
MIETKLQPAPSPTELSNASDVRKRNFRIAYIAPSLARGYYWQPVFRELTRQVPNTVIFTSDWPGFLPGYEDKFNVQHLRGYKYFVSEVTQTGAEVGFIWANPSILWKLMRFRPDVIFASAFNVWTIYALVYKMLSGCRVIVGWEGNAPTTTYLDRPIRLKARRLMSRVIDAAYSNTKEGVEYLRTVIGMPAEKLSHHPVQVPEVNALRSTSEGPPLQYKRRPVFLFVGSIVKRKGWRYLIDATISLKKKLGSRFTVVMVGPGEELGELHEMVSSHGLGDVVEVSGHISYDTLGRYFRACDVFVLPTLEDTWGMVVLEAMAFAKAILCSKYAGSKEMVQHGVNGFVFDPYSPEELSHYMQSFIEQPEQIVKFGEQSRTILEPFTPSRSGRMLADLAEKTLALAHPKTKSSVEVAVTTIERVSQPGAYVPAKQPSTRKQTPRIVTLSWDDGHRADLRVAELLKARGLAATFYVPVERDERSLTGSDLRMLASAGFEIGAHGYSQKFLWQLSAEELAAEIEPCRPALEDTIGEPVTMFCYPRGRYDDNVVRALKRAGYQGARTVRMLSTSLEFDPFEIPTTAQIYPHERLDYIRNVLRGWKLDSLKTCLTNRGRLSNWLNLSKKLFDSVLENGGIWHIYGHSWELDGRNLWKDLEELLEYVSHREGVLYVPNGQLLSTIQEFRQR